MGLTQLERLLNLPEDSLTKEIRLMQDLQELFLEYQVPSDLLRFDVDVNPNASGAVRAQRRSPCVAQSIVSTARVLAGTHRGCEAPRRDDAGAHPRLEGEGDR